MVKRALIWLSKRNYLDVAAAATIVLFSMLIWWPTRYLPYHWDSALKVGEAAGVIHNQGFARLAEAVSGDLAQPPLLPAVIAWLQGIVGESLLAQHLLILPFLPLMLWVVYLLGKRTISAEAGLLAMLLTALTPPILAEYGSIDGILPGATLMLWSLWFLLKKDYLPAALVITLGLLFDLGTLLYWPLLGFVFYSGLKKHNGPISPAKYKVLLVPVLVLAIWFGFHYLQTGWFIYRQSWLTALPLDGSRLVERLLLAIDTLFLAQNRWLISLAGLSLVIWMVIKGYLKKLPVILKAILIQIVLVIIFFALTGIISLRDGVALYPLMYLGLFWLMAESYPKLWPEFNYRNLAVAGAAGILFMTSLHPGKVQTGQYDFRAPGDLSYQDYITVFRQSGLYLQSRLGQGEAYGSFPEELYFARPDLGYVQRPVEIKPCQEFVLNRETEQVIVLHAYSAGQTECRNLLDRVETKPHNRFESNGKWVELYLVSASDSAELNSE